MVLENVIKTVMDEIRQIVRTETVVGKEIKAGNSTIIPVSKISFGFGGGGGVRKESAEGTGVGGGATVEPVAFIVVTDGKAQLLPLGEKTGTLGKIIDLVPEVLAKLGSKKKKHEPEEKED